MMLDNKPVGTNDVVVDARSKQQMSYCGIAIESTAEGWFVLPDYCCKICGSVLAREDHDQHLNRCAWGGSASGRVMEVQARAFHGVMRLTMIAGPEATLADLDASIRGTWMEPCCMERHVSTIGLRDKTVQDQQCEFVSPTAGDAWDAPVTMTLGSNNKGGTLAAGRTNLFDRFVNPNEVIAYTYDMATPSSCMLLVTGIKCARKEALDFLARAGNKVAVVVRNLPPEVPCIVCGETSSHVMPGVGGLDYAEEDDFFCVKHAPVRLAVRHAHLEWPCGAAGMVIPRVPAEGSSRLPQQSALRCMWVSDGRQPDHCQWIGRQSTRSGCCRASA